VINKKTKPSRRILIPIYVLLIVSLATVAESADFRIGAGRQDITGPAAERTMMGYSDLSQTTKGIHLRLKSRAFVIEEPTSGVRVAIVVADLGWFSIP